MANKSRVIPPSYGWIRFWLPQKPPGAKALSSDPYSIVGSKYSERYTKKDGGKYPPANLAFLKAFVQHNPPLAEWYILAGATFKIDMTKRGWEDIKQLVGLMFLPRIKNQEVLDSCNEQTYKIISDRCPGFTAASDKDKEYYFVAGNPVTRFFEIIYRAKTLLNPLNWLAFLSIWADEKVKESYYKGIDNTNNLRTWGAVPRRFWYSFLSTITASFRWVCTAIASPTYYIFSKKGGLIPGVVGMLAAVGVYALIMNSPATPVLGFVGGVPYMAKVLLETFFGASANFAPAVLGIVGIGIAVGVMLAVGAFFVQTWSNTQALWRAGKHALGIESVDEQEMKRLGSSSSQDRLRTESPSQNTSAASLGASTTSINSSNNSNSNSPDVEMRQLKSEQQQQSQHSSSNSLASGSSSSGSGSRVALVKDKDKEKDPFNNGNIRQSGIYEGTTKTNPLYQQEESSRIQINGSSSSSSSANTNDKRNDPNWKGKGPAKNTT